MRKNLCLEISIVSMLILIGLSARIFADEFVGPFVSWKNIKIDYNAKGDGKSDDTNAIQQAFDDLRYHKDHCVLYFPAGIYRITNTVKTIRESHTDCMGITVIGEDPETTIIQWDGKEGGMMVKYDAWYSKISRLTLDGMGKAKIALAYGDKFSTYNETSDMIFRDVVDGMSMGTAGYGQAENTVLRCQFIRCSGAGLRTNDFNSMDIWVWYCRFEDCGYGLYNGAGNFHAYESLFLRSKKADIGTTNLMAFSFVNNTSINSNCFMDWAGGHTWGSPCSITGNRIIEPTGDFAIRLGNGGPYLLMDNIIKSRSGKTEPEVYMTWADQALVGNTYTIPDPVKADGRYLIIAENIVQRETISDAMPVLPKTPPKVVRKVFDIPVGADAKTIQNVINQAIALKGSSPVVHFPKGVYSIDHTLTIPPNCDIQIIGDGGAETATILQWAGKSGEYIWRLEGPSHAVIKDLYMQTGSGNGILVNNCDQQDGYILTEQLNSSGSPSDEVNIGVLIKGLEQTDVLMRNLQGGTNLNTWVKVVGDPERRVGVKTPGQVSVLCGATGTSEAHYSVENGGRLVVRSVYHEVSGDSPQAILLNDSGTLSIDATRFSYKTAPDRPLISLDSFHGKFTILTGMLLPVNSTHTAEIHITGNGEACSALCMGNMFWVNELGASVEKVWHNDANPPAMGAILLCNMNSGLEGALEQGGFGRLENRGSEDEIFILEMLKPLREAKIWLLGKPQEGKTAVYIHRVMIDVSKEGVGIELNAISE